MPCQAWWNSRLIATVWIFISQSLPYPQQCVSLALDGYFHRKMYLFSINIYTYTQTLKNPVSPLHNSTQCAYQDYFFSYRISRHGSPLKACSYHIHDTSHPGNNSGASLLALHKPHQENRLHLLKPSPKSLCELSRFLLSLPGDWLLSVPKLETQWELPQREVLAPPLQQHKALRLTGPLVLQSSLLILPHSY